MRTELYILKLRLLSALRWIKELGFIRIFVLLFMIAAVFKMFLDINNTPTGLAVIIVLNASLLYSIHFSRKDELFLSSLDVNKKLLFASEYLIHSLPFLILVLISNYFYFVVYIFILLGILVNIKSGNKIKINFTTGKSFFPLYAFEWIAGLRNNLVPLFIIYLLGIIFCYQVAGGVLSIILLTFIFSSFFIENEPLLFIEAYSKNEKKFLRIKLIQTANIFLKITSPLVLLHLISFYERWYLIMGVVIICLIILSASVLTKYAFYSEDIADSKMNYIINGVIVFSFASSFYMTGPFLFPLPFVMMVYLYKKASQNLKNIRFISY